MRKKVEGYKAPQRQFSRSALPIGVVERGTVDGLAVRLLARVRDTRSSQGEGSMVFGDPEHRLFVVRIGSAAGTQMLKEHAGWLLGLYGANTSDGKRVCFPLVEQVADDIRAHYDWEELPPPGWPAQLDLFAA